MVVRLKILVKGTDEALSSFSRVFTFLDLWELYELPIKDTVFVGFVASWI
jgi:hypothetical protein